ncbi:phage tail tube protein [Streptomyces microflavus]|uniref:phage tail tube protein n=1 Tax=Streptomyces microflavus TaxID=1919 RepID=UPI0037F5798F
MSTSTKKNTQTRFLRRGLSKILWVPDLNDPKYPSRREITKAFVLTNAVSDIEGWALENDPIETPDMGSTFNSSIPGNDKAENSSLTFYEDRFSDAIEQQLPKGAKGYVVLLRKGDLPGSRSVDVFPVQVATRAATYSTGNEAAKFKVDFTITDEPSLDCPVPKAQPRPLPDEDCDDDHGHGQHHGDHDGDHVDVTVVSTTKTKTETEATVREHDADEG